MCSKARRSTAEDQSSERQINLIHSVIKVFAVLYVNKQTNKQTQNNTTKIYENRNRGRKWIKEFKT
jgi:phosphoribosyl-AMP cyclohydrolase